MAENFITCPNGHWYDANLYPTCPYCVPTEEQGTGPRPGDITVPEYPPEPTIPSVEQYMDTPTDITSDSSSINDQLNDDVTQAFYGDFSDDIDVEPVVGWLACVDGDHFGESFNLKSGRNFIGRNADKNDVVLSGDKTVSRDRHAIIVYDPVGKMFIAQAGESNGLFYVNGKVVLDNVSIKAYDVLAIGKEKLIFIPLCGKEFCWENTSKLKGEGGETK